MLPAVRPVPLRVTRPVTGTSFGLFPQPGTVPTSRTANPAARRRKDVMTGSGLIEGDDLPVGRPDEKPDHRRRGRELDDPDAAVAPEELRPPRARRAPI